MKLQTKFKMTKYLLIFILFSISHLSFGQIKNQSSIDSIFIEWDKKDAPGCAMGIYKDGKNLYAKGYGMANLEYDIPNSPNSVFRIASTSKQFTAACILLLVEQGKLSLQDSLSGIFPDFPDYADRISIQQLLNHTSGIRDYLQIAYLRGLGDDDYYEDDQIMEWLIRQTDLNFAPGEEHLYSNSGYWLLGQIVNKVAEKSMADFAQEQIFTPLKMTHTHFHNDHNKIVKNRASGYYPIGEDSYQMAMTTLNMIGDGGIFTTINDIKKWDDSFYQSNVLSRDFWKMMTQRGVLNNGDTIDYASGLDIGEYKGLKTIRHGGAFVGYRAEILRFPDEHLTIVIFANRGDANPSRKANELANIILKDKFNIEKPKEAKKPLAEEPSEEIELKSAVGTYQIRVGLAMDISLKNDTLFVFQKWNESTYPILRTPSNSFQIPGNEGLAFRFTELKEGFTQTLVILQEGRETKASRKDEIDFSKMDIKDFSGNYYSKELDVKYIFKVEEGILKLKVENTRDKMDCSAIDIDQFSMSFGILRFQRVDGSIKGFQLDSGRVNNVKFIKE